MRKAAITLGYGLVWLVGLSVVVAPGGISQASASERSNAVVKITDEGVDPPSVAAGIGSVTIIWRNESTLPRQVVDPHFGLFNSGQLNPGEEFSYVPRIAGTFSYTVDTYPSLGLKQFQMEAELQVLAVFRRLVYRPRLGWVVRWAPRKPPPEREEEKIGFGGLAFDVQKGAFRYGTPTKPFVGKWRRWHRGTPRTSDVLPIKCDGRKYRVRVRVRDINSGAQSRWSRPIGAGCVED